MNRDDLTIILLGTLLIMGITGVYLGFTVIAHEISPLIGGIGGIAVIMAGGSPEMAREVTTNIASHSPTPTTTEYVYLTIGLVSISVANLWIYTTGTNGENQCN